MTPEALRTHAALALVLAADALLTAYRGDDSVTLQVRPPRADRSSRWEAAIVGLTGDCVAIAFGDTLADAILACAEAARKELAE